MNRQQPTLFDPVPSTVTLGPGTRTRPWRRVRETSRAAYAVARETLIGREGDVLRWLAGYYNSRQTWPTAAELTEARRHEMVGDWTRKVQHVRRAITELQELGLVEAAGSRPCVVARRKCETWRVVSR